MTHWGARTRQIGTFPVNRENISPAQNAGLPEGSGPLGVAATCIVRLGVLDTLPCCVMDIRRARSTFLHKKRVPEIFPLPSSLRAACGAKETIHFAKKFPSTSLSFLTHLYLSLHIFIFPYTSLSFLTHLYLSLHIFIFPYTTSEIPRGPDHRVCPILSERSHSGQGHPVQYS
jgi:hypothetical protein